VIPVRRISTQPIRRNAEPVAMNNALGSTFDPGRVNMLRMNELQRNDRRRDEKDDGATGTEHAHRSSIYHAHLPGL
jgi:hypothetical protein